MSNFRIVDRLTRFLLPPSVDDWLPERHLANSPDFLEFERHLLTNKFALVPRSMNHHGAKRCISVSGLSIDAAIAKEDR